MAILSARMSLFTLVFREFGPRSESFAILNTSRLDILKSTFCVASHEIKVNQPTKSAFSVLS